MSAPDDALQLCSGLMEIASSAARLAGRYALEHFKRGVASERKAGFYDPVTECDRQAERLIEELILGAHPDSTIVGEEGGQRGTGAIHWYVDPIDRTNNFIDRIPFFCVSIGAASGGRLVAGAIYEPVRDELWAASLNGASLNGEPITSAGHSVDSGSVLLTGFPYTGGRASPADYESFQKLVAAFRAVRRLGSTALELAYVACGRGDVAFETNANAWDVAAGMLLVEQAGGRYLAIRSDNQEPWTCPRFVATCPQFDLERSSLTATRLGRT